VARDVVVVGRPVLGLDCPGSRCRRVVLSCDCAVSDPGLVRCLADWCYSQWVRSVVVVGCVVVVAVGCCCFAVEVVPVLGLVGGSDLACCHVVHGPGLGSAVLGLGSDPGLDSAVPGLVVVVEQAASLEVLASLGIDQRLALWRQRWETDQSRSAA